jgi:hypothetical protein
VNYYHVLVSDLQIALAHGDEPGSTSTGSLPAVEACPYFQKQAIRSWLSWGYADRQSSRAVVQENRHSAGSRQRVETDPSIPNSRL